VERPWREDLNRAPALEIDDDGAVALPLPQRPVIDVNNRRRCSGMHSCPSDSAEQRVATGRHGELVGKPTARGATDGHANLCMGARQAAGSPALRRA